MMNGVKLGRRGFLKALGIAPAAAPLAAKAAADAEIGKLLGIGYGLAPEANPVIESAMCGHAIVGGTTDGILSKAELYYRTLGIPEHMQAVLRRRAQYVGVLDPDLAAKRSWSMSVKIQEQRQRNYQRQIEQIGKDFWENSKRQSFRQITGWDWPW